MRTAGTTPEPMGAGLERPRIFCVQKHDATRLHFDLRLEHRGTLLSWAVPRGPSRDPADRRMAVQTEDHPVEYADFEGVIPDGNYGAGPMILWDRGTFVPLEDFDEGLAKGKLLFELRGWKLRGVWTLVRTRAKGNGPSKEWLLIAHRSGHRDEHVAAGAEGDDFPQQSIKSGLTVEELAAGRDPVAELRAACEAAGAPRRTVELDPRPMLAETRDEPFDDDGWLFELKHDGFRMIAARDGQRVRLGYRSGTDATGTWPDLAAAVAALPHRSFVADGEVVILDQRGVASFHGMQQRAMLRRSLDIARMAAELPATLYLFDLLAYDGHDLRALPLVARKELLRRLIPPVGPIRWTDHVEGRGVAFFEAVRQHDLEGIMAKRADSRYRGGRSPDWLKIKVPRIDPFVVVGFTAPSGSRSGFGALHVATHVDGKLTYAGRAGSGFDAKGLDELHRTLSAMRVDRPPFVQGAPTDKSGHTWCRAELVCEVRYREWAEDGHLRQPVFLGLRADLKPADVHWKRGAPPSISTTPVASDEPASDAAPAPRLASPDARTVKLSNLDKVFWPGEGYTKGDLVAYYRAIAPVLLPLLRDRAVMLTRFPDGISGKSFFQKDPIGVEDLESLLHVANLGTIPLHVWSSRMSDLGRPDWTILDLDPKGAPFAHVIKLARAIHALTEELGLPSFPKTSGQAGMHILIPLGGACTHDQSRAFAEVLAQLVAGEHPDLATTERTIAERGGRVYLDYLQNGHGKLIASAYCVRPVAGAPVSTPLRWSEVTARLDPRKHTIKTVPARVDRHGDPLAAILTAKPDLVAALARLDERVRRTAR